MGRRRVQTQMGFLELSSAVLNPGEEDGKLGESESGGTLSKRYY